MGHDDEQIAMFLQGSSPPACSCSIPGSKQLCCSMLCLQVGIAAPSSPDQIAAEQFAFVRDKQALGSLAGVVWAARYRHRTLSESLVASGTGKSDAAC
jgi:hypothetical protein